MLSKSVEPWKLVEGSSVVEKTESGLPQILIYWKRQHNGLLVCSQRDYWLWKFKGVKPQLRFIQRTDLYQPSTSLAALLDFGAKNLDDHRFKAQMDLVWESAVPIPRYEE